MPKGGPAPEDVREQLARILSSATFSRTDSLNRFLSFVVEATLEGRADEVKETVLGLEVFGRGAGFDPRIDPIVRVTARKLRDRLEGYYREEGRGDCTVIELPKGTYVPSFRLAEASSPMEAVAPPAASHVRRPRVWVAGAVAVGIVTLVWPQAERLDSIQIRRLASEPGYEGDAAFSPDGKSLAYNRLSQEEELKVLSEGASAPRTLVRTRHMLLNSQIPVWTPDGSRVCYIRYVPRNSLWCVGAAGGEPSLLFPDVRSPQFTPDGKSLFFLRPVNGKSTVFRSSPPGAPPEQVDLGQIEDSTDTLLLSPDGLKWAIRHSERPASESTSASITVRPFRGGSPRPIPSDPGWVTTLVGAWFPDSRHMLLGERSQDQTTTRLVIADTESPARRLVLTDVGSIASATVSPDGRRIVYASNGGRSGFNVFEHSMDGKRIRALAAETRVGLWSPQGDRYLYHTGGSGKDNTLWTRALDNSAPFAVIGGKWTASAFAYSPDGLRIAYLVGGNQPGVETVSSMGGQPTRVLNTARALSPCCGGPCWSSDGKWLFYFQDGNLSRVASDGGGQPDLVRDKVGGGLVCSPSGRWILFNVPSRRKVEPGGFPGDLMVMSTDTREVRTFSLKEDHLLQMATLAPDGRTLYLPQIDRAFLDVVDTRTGEVLRTIHLETEPSQTLGGRLSVHPDGKRLLVTSVSSPADLRIVEGFAGPERGWLRWLRHWESPRSATR